MYARIANEDMIILKSNHDINNIDTFRYEKL